MDLIEDYIINNVYLREDIKLNLLESDEMIAYSFVGAFFHFNAPPESYSEDIEEEDNDEDINIDEVLTLYHRLTQADLNLILRCPEVMKKFGESISVIDSNKKLSEDDR
jgi:hypothetical protein